MKKESQTAWQRYLVSASDPDCAAQQGHCHAGRASACCKHWLNNYEFKTCVPVFMFACQTSDPFLQSKESS